MNVWFMMNEYNDRINTYKEAEEFIYQISRLNIDKIKTKDEFYELIDNIIQEAQIIYKKMLI